MSNDEKYELEVYQQRQRDWSSIAISQLSNVNNLLLTLSSGFLVFVFDKISLKGVYLTIEKVDWPTTFYAAYIVSLFLSIISGIVVLFSRLYDIRISRNLALTRKRVFKLYKVSIADVYIDIRPQLFKELSVLWRIIVCDKLDLISEGEAKKSSTNATDNFHRLREDSKLLGYASWRWTKHQALLFTLSILLYCIFRFTQKP